MKITITKSLSPEATPVFVLSGSQKIKAHPFFRFLSSADQANLTAFEIQKPKVGDYEKIFLLSNGRRLLLFSFEKPLNYRKIVRLMRRVIVVARREKVDKITVSFDDFSNKEVKKMELLAEMLAQQFELANFEFIRYKEVPKDGWFFVKELEIHLIGKGTNGVLEKALARGKIIGEEINKTRILANTPGGDMTPQKLAEAARVAGREAGFKVKILEEGEIHKLKMGGILGVSQGSSERPRFIIMEYLPVRQAGLKSRKGEEPVVLIGKGVTFDTGGLNLKPSTGIYEMHMDMSGGAAVIHTLAALARLNVRKNIIGLVPAVENMPSGASYRPGDILRTMSGKTIEVLNTDAEGRIVLADALTYAKHYKPRLVIDVATLTGAAEVALGQRASAIFSTDAKIENKLRECGELVYDLVWPLPLWEDYEEEVKGTFGDVANSGKTRYGDAILGAMFLWQFIKTYPWVHIDMAPRMTTIESDNLAKGAAGAPVALLTQFLREF